MIYLNVVWRVDVYGVVISFFFVFGVCYGVLDCGRISGNSVVDVYVVNYDVGDGL